MIGNSFFELDQDIINKLARPYSILNPARKSEAEFGHNCAVKTWASLRGTCKHADGSVQCICYILTILVIECCLERKLSHPVKLEKTVIFNGQERIA